MRKFKLKKSIKKYLIFGALGLIVLIIGIVLIKTAVYHKSDTYKLLELGYNKAEVNLITSKLDKEDIKDLLKEKYDVNIAKLMKEKYYLNKNLDSYLIYLNKNANSPLTDVVATVNVKADNTWYKEDVIKETDLTKKELILINKFYKLNKDTTFADLKNIPLTYAYSGNKLREIALTKYTEMASVAKDAGLSLIITASYRSYSGQEKLYNNSVNYGGDNYADKVSARPGHSDHQSGLSVDITKYNTLLAEFETTNEFTWLQENAYKYGFILRYPKDKKYLTGFDYEPWHYRYVGIKAAKTIHDENITFDEYYAYYIEK